MAVLIMDKEVEILLWMSYVALVMKAPSKTADQTLGSPMTAATVKTSELIVTETVCHRLPEIMRNVTWSSERQNLLVRRATIEDSAQPAHPRNVCRVFADRMCILQPLGYPNRDKWDSLSLCWSHRSYCGFRRALFHILHVLRSDFRY